MKLVDVMSVDNALQLFVFLILLQVRDTAKAFEEHGKVRTNK